jgi:hypothetical protein
LHDHGRAYISQRMVAYFAFPPFQLLLLVSGLFGFSGQDILDVPVNEFGQGVLFGLGGFEVLAFLDGCLGSLCSFLGVSFGCEGCVLHRVSF